MITQAWYAVHTKARQESVAAEHLTRQRYVVHLPMLRAPKRRRGRWHEVTEPLFPGYLFVRLDLQRHNLAPIRSTRGVKGLVRFGSAPRSVPTGVVEGLMAASAGSDGAIRRERLFRPGDRVEIVSGPLAGLRAIFLAQRGEDRARLLLELLGRENRIDLFRDQLVAAT